MLGLNLQSISTDRDKLLGHLLSFMVLSALASPALPAAETRQQQLLVFAAASLTDAMQELAADYEKMAHVEGQIII